MRGKTFMLNALIDAPRSLIWSRCAAKHIQVFDVQKDAQQKFMQNAIIDAPRSLIWNRFMENTHYYMYYIYNKYNFAIPKQCVSNDF